MIARGEAEVARCIAAGAITDYQISGAVNIDANVVSGDVVSLNTVIAE